jgi:hypothetical protein
MRVVSIYVQLLGSALDQSHSDEDTTIGEALAQLLECRNRLGANLSFYTGTDWAPAAVADQLAYDVSLVEFSRHLGIEVDPTKFGQPEHERARLERALVSRGICLEEFDTSGESREELRRAWGQR